MPAPPSLSLSAASQPASQPYRYTHFRDAESAQTRTMAAELYIFRREENHLKCFLSCEIDYMEQVQRNWEILKYCMIDGWMDGWRAHRNRLREAHLLIWEMGTSWMATERRSSREMGGGKFLGQLVTLLTDGCSGGCDLMVVCSCAFLHIHPMWLAIMRCEISGRL